MGKIFENLYLILGIGVVLAVVIMLFPDTGYAPPYGTLNGVLQWSHVFFGITWIGLLYYFNFVQIPTMPNIPAELKPGVSKYIAPNALFYFRWGAAFTVLTGLILAWLYDELIPALTLQESARLIGILEQPTAALGNIPVGRKRSGAGASASDAEEPQRGFKLLAIRQRPLR